METAGHQQTIDYITAELAKTKFDTIKTQRWVAREAGRTMAMTNIIARLNPDNPRRMIVATHYDSIIKAYRDAKTSGRADAGRQQFRLRRRAAAGNRARDVADAGSPPIGIDMIFFDGEEGAISMGAGDPNFKPIGSAHFAERLADFYPNAKPEKCSTSTWSATAICICKPEPSSIRIRRRRRSRSSGTSA